MATRKETTKRPGGKPAARSTEKSAAPAKLTTQRPAALAPAPRAGPAAPVASLLRGLPPLADAQRAAFEALFGPADCEAAARDADPAAVARDAAAALGGIGAAVAAHETALRYGPARLRFLADCVADLADLAADAASPADAAARAFDRSAAAAVAARDDLAHALGLVTGRDPAEARALADARGGGDEPVSLARALRALGALVQAWLGRSDARSRALAASHHLGQGDADEAVRVARRLERAYALKARRAAAAMDPAELRRAAGRVVLELGVLDAALARARAHAPDVPALALGPALRRALRG